MRTTILLTGMLIAQQIKPLSESQVVALLFAILCVFIWDLASARLETLKK